MQSKVEEQATQIAQLKEEIEQLRQSKREDKTRFRDKLAAAKTKNRKLKEVNRDTLEQLEAVKQKCQESERQALEDRNIRRLLHNQVMELKGNIRVFCRVRPFLGNERVGDNFRVEEGRKIIAVPPAGSRSGNSLEFKYDYVFGPKAQQKDVFVEISQLVQSALDGHRVCIFAYGQTGSGKRTQRLAAGMIPRSVEQVFETAERMAKYKWTFTFRVSFIEIYNETYRDLLDRPNKGNSLNVKIHPETKQVDVPNLTVEYVHSTVTILKLLERANRNRVSAATEANERSSRSHSIFQLHIQGTQGSTGQTLNGALNLVDLAGSERLKESEATGDRFKETQLIKKSLSALADVIVALANKQKHIPHRNSKLTTLLSDSLGGESKTLMFVNVSPVGSSFNESVCSLRFTTRVNQCHNGIVMRNGRLHTKH